MGELYNEDHMLAPFILNAKYLLMNVIYIFFKYFETPSIYFSSECETVTAIN
jgi:hypothetical protein